MIAIQRIFLKRWCLLTLLIFVCYNAIWLPVLAEGLDYTLMQNLESMTLDFMICIVISFMNCLVLSMLGAKASLPDWTNKMIAVVIAGILIFNLAMCFPLAIVKWWFYDRIFHDCPWNLGENYLDTYIMASVTSLITVSYMLIWVTLALRLKEKFLAEAKIKSIKNQINPHFLFNNLNAGIALIDYAPDKAVDFFTSMSRVFRTVLDRSMESTQSLNEELDDLQQYLNLLRIRFGEAIKIDVWLSDTERNMEILTGSLQLVFENIVKHNKFSADNPITVSVLTDKDTLMVINDFRPLSDKSGSRGIGHSALIHRYEDFGRHNISFRQDGDKYISQIPLFPAK